MPTRPWKKSRVEFGKIILVQTTPYTLLHVGTPFKRMSTLLVHVTRIGTLGDRVMLTLDNPQPSSAHVLYSSVGGTNVYISFSAHGIHISPVPT